ncbi:MAG: ATP-binding protein [Clostridia bacterium]|nr:ATP-binding protein [Clostridia bacterium]
MLRTFFEKTDEDTSVYFRNLEIWKCGDKYISEQGKYPVIYLDFKNVYTTSWPEMLSSIKICIVREYKRHRIVKSALIKSDAKIFMSIENETADGAHFSDSLRFLSEALYAYYGVKPIILIDEYDAPIQGGYEKGFYEDIISFMRVFLSAALKGNDSFNFAVLMGVTRTAGAGLFSGFNNTKIYTVLDDRYSSYFGFTKDEVKKLLDDFGASEKYDEVCEWYDGYVFGNEKIFNPVSVLDYVQYGFEARAYWVGTSNESEFKSITGRMTDKIFDNLITLSLGQSVTVPVRADLTYADFTDADNIYSVLFMSGYLKPCVPEGEHHDAELDVVMKSARRGEAIPVTLVNKEIAISYTTDILSYAKNVFRFDFAEELQTAVNSRDLGKTEEGIKKYIRDAVSYYDDREGFYHGFVLGLISQMRAVYAITSNRESGDGRYDITLEPLRGIENVPGIVLEFKVCEKEEDLLAKAGEALAQIDKNDYGRDMVTRGVKNVIKIGMAFCGKNVEFAS